MKKNININIKKTGLITRIDYNIMKITRKRPEPLSADDDRIFIQLLYSISFNNKQLYITRDLSHPRRESYTQPSPTSWMWPMTSDRFSLPYLSIISLLFMSRKMYMFVGLVQPLRFQGGGDTRPSYLLLSEMEI